MTQPEDTLTIDMLDPAAKKKGRPQTKSPKSAKQRQRDRRQRLALNDRTFVTVEVSTAIANRLKVLSDSGIDKNKFVETTLHDKLFLAKIGQDDDSI